MKINCQSSTAIFWVATVLFSLINLQASEIRVCQFAEDNGAILRRSYPDALSGLVDSARKSTGLPLAESPILLNSFLDPRLRECPFLYVNWDDYSQWAEMSEEEVGALRKYILDGGFVYVDAGIAAEFLRGGGGGVGMQSQHHSYAEWQERPEVRDFFKRVLPEYSFQALGRDDPLFGCFYQGLPDTGILPPSVREYTMREKWPNGTYSAVGIRLGGHLAVLATPVVAMGWGKDVLGGWTTEIRMRVLEDRDELRQMLPQAAVLGPKYEARREDGGIDQIYCQDGALPAWLHAPTGDWRVFRYYDSKQISDYTHVFYTRLGTNFLIAALMGI